MKRILISLLLFLLLDGVVLADQLDSARMHALSARLEEYFAALVHEDTDVQKRECDFLIESSSDSLVRQYVALEIYEHYADSPVMGAEAVAVHLADRWFLSGIIPMRSPQQLMETRVYAEFNRLSQLGMKAPSLNLLTLEGEAKEFFNEHPGRYSVLLFYDADCSKCKIESLKLRNLLSLGDYPVDLLAVYVGDDRSKWAEYRSAYLEFVSEETDVIHLWDPELESDFQRKYGVLHTPGIFLIDGDGVIIGRRLDADALQQMLKDVFEPEKLVYGSKESQVLFDGILGSEPSSMDVISLADMIADRTLLQKDTLMFRQLAGDLLYYLAPKTGEGLKEGTAGFISRYILSADSVWKSPDDSMKVVGFAMIMDDLLSKAVPGECVADLKLPGEMLRRGKLSQGEFRLRRLGGVRNYILFHTDGCEVCAQEKKAAVRLSEEDKRTRVLMVNVDRLLASPSLAASVFDSFDLTTLPYVVQVDGKGKVLRRYISLNSL